MTHLRSHSPVSAGQGWASSLGPSSKQGSLFGIAPQIQDSAFRSSSASNLNNSLSVLKGASSVSALLDRVLIYKAKPPTWPFAGCSKRQPREREAVAVSNILPPPLLPRSPTCWLYLPPLDVSWGAGARTSGWSWWSLFLPQTSWIHRWPSSPSQIQTWGCVSPVEGRVNDYRS